MTQYETKDSGERIDYDSGMRRDVQEGKPRFDLLHPDFVPYKDQFLTRCAELMARGAEKYGDRNWELANSEEELKRFRASALRHLQQWLHGETDEDHAAATFFNLMCHESIKYKIDHTPIERDEPLFGFHDLGWTLDFTSSDVPKSVIAMAMGVALEDLQDSNALETNGVQESFARRG